MKVFQWPHEYPDFTIYLALLNNSIDFEHDECYEVR